MPVPHTNQDILENAEEFQAKVQEQLEIATSDADNNTKDKATKALFMLLVRMELATDRALSTFDPKLFNSAKKTGAATGQAKNEFLISLRTTTDGTTKLNSRYADFRKDPSALAKACLVQQARAKKAQELSEWVEVQSKHQINTRTAGIQDGSKAATRSAAWNKWNDYLAQTPASKQRKSGGPGYTN